MQKTLASRWNHRLHGLPARVGASGALSAFAFPRWAAPVGAPAAAGAGCAPVLPRPKTAALQRREPRSTSPDCTPLVLSCGPAVIQNFDVGVDAFDDKSSSQKKVHIRVVQRSGRKNITTVQGLDDDLDIAKICRALKKILACNGSVSRDSTLGEVIQLQGDQREAVKSFLHDLKIYEPKEDRIVVHG